VIGCAAILRASLFAKHGSRSEGRFTPTPTRGGDAFGRELTGNHRFSSSGLNLTFERLLLGVSLHLQEKANSSNPHKSDSESATSTHNVREAPLCFTRNHWCHHRVAGSRRHQRSPDEGLERQARRKLLETRRLEMRVKGGTPAVILRLLRHHRHMSVSYWKCCKVVS
jgi:hypothetical protein